MFIFKIQKTDWFLDADGLQTKKNADIMHISFGGIAQLVERLHGMQEVSGSIPLTSTKILKAWLSSQAFFICSVRAVFES